MDFQRDTDRYEGQESFRYESLNQFLANPVQSGFNSISYGDGMLDILVDDRGEETTFVMFHAATSAKHQTYPLFIGQNLAEGKGANFVYVSDPCLDIGLGLGWYAGDRARRLQKDLVLALSHVFSNLTEHRFTVFFGASGGGFASLYYSARFNGSLAIAINPQTNILNYLPGAVDPFLETAWQATPQDDLEFDYDLSSIYREGTGNAVIYLQNLGDRPHIRQHLLPFLHTVSIDQLSLGVMFGEWGIGHRAPGVAVISPVLEAAIKARGDWLLAFEELEVEIMTNQSDLTEIDERSTKYLLDEKKRESI